MTKNLIIRHARQIVAVCQNGERVLKGNEMNNVVVLQGNGEGLSIVVDGNGKIECIDHDGVIMQKFKSSAFEAEIDASGMSVVPGSTERF